MSISEKVVTGVKWASASKIGRIVLQYLTLLVLVSLLSPSDFGLMSTAMIFIGFFNIIKDFGVTTALIQIEEESDSLYSSVFWLNLLIGFFFFLILFFFSEFVATFYNHPELNLILKVLSINFIFNSIGVLQLTLFEKKLEYNIYSRIELISSLVGSIVGILAALFDLAVWALVFRTMSDVLTNMILSWLFSSFRPKFIFKLADIKKVFKFGINLSGFNILNYFVRNADYFLIGKYIGMTELGYYSLAYRLMLFPIQNISAVVGRVLYPALSRLNQKKNEIRQLYTDMAESVAFITFPLMVGFFVINEKLITSFFAEKWEPIIDLVYILVPVGLIQSVYTLAGSIFQSQDKTDLWLRWGILSAIVTVSGFYIGLNWGIVGVALSYLITNLLLVYPGTKIAFDLVELKVFVFFKKVSLPLVLSLAMGVIVFMLTLFSGIVSNFILLLMQIAMGILCYFSLSYYYNKKNMLRIIKNIIR